MKKIEKINKKDYAKMIYTQKGVLYTKSD